MIGHMPMPLLVDCYNVLHVDMPQAWAGLDEAGLCRLLARGGWPNGSAVVVCDGAVKPGGPARSPVESVELVYAGRGQSADDLIIHMIDADSAPRRLTIVSSDRQIQKAARRRRCRVVASEVFVRMLATACGQQKRGHADGASAVGGDKAGPLNERQVQQWLKWLGVDAQEDRDTREHF